VRKPAGKCKSSDRLLKLPTKEIISAQNIIFASDLAKINQKWRFLAQNLLFLDQNFPTKTKFSDNLKLKE